MNIRSLLAGAALTLAVSAPAFAEEAPSPAYNVLEADTRLPFATTRVSGFTVDDNNALILHAGPSRTYRAVLWSSCDTDVRWAREHIAIDARPNGTLDRTGTIIVNGRRCPIESFDRVERIAAEPSAEDAE
jgi:hypothetical protein